PFDPDDPSTFASTPHHVRTARTLMCLACLYPILLLVMLYATWFAAWMALGHVPQSSLDDPKGIDGIEIPYAITTVLLLGLIPALLVSAGCALGAFAIRVRRGVHGALLNLG